MLLLIMLGSVAGLLSGLFGIGGGIIIVPVLQAYFIHLNIHPPLAIASGTSLAIMCVTTLIASLSHQHKGAIQLSIIKWIIPFSMVSAIIGVKFANLIDPIYIKFIFCSLTIWVGVNLILGRLFKTSNRLIKVKVYYGLAGATVGFLSGLIGIGGGVILVPLLGMMGLSLPQAAATSSACTFPTVLMGALSALLIVQAESAHTLHLFGTVYGPAVIGVGLPSILTTWVGVELSHYLPIKWMSRLFGVVLMLLLLIWL